jgi:hypothetical protein
MKRTAFCILMLNAALGHADEGAWNFLEVKSAYRDGDWGIFRSNSVSMSLSRERFSAAGFEAQSDKPDGRTNSYKVQGTIKPSTSIYGDDAVATFTPLESDAGPVTCKGKYLKRNTDRGLVEEMNFLCNGSDAFISFKRITKKKP